MPYQRKEWECREIVTADDLNNIEEGIEEALSREIKEYKSKHTGSGALVSSVAFSLTDYTYSEDDVASLYVNGLHLSADEYTISGSGGTIIVSLATPVSLGASDSIDITVLKYVR